MAELRIWTTRHTIRVAAPPKRVFQLIAHVDRWPRLFDTLVAVEHIGFDGTSERIRFWKKADGSLRSWTSARELNTKRLQVRFRQEDYPRPLTSLGGLWLVQPKKDGGCLISLDHYFRVAEDNTAAAQHVEEKLDTISNSMLQALRHNAESGEVDDNLLLFPQKANLTDSTIDPAEGVYPL